MDSIPDVWIKTNVGPSFVKWSFHKRCGIRSSCEPDTVLFVVKPPLTVSVKKWTSILLIQHGRVQAIYNAVNCEVLMLTVH
jgi:hypothetical protein